MKKLKRTLTALAVFVLSVTAGIMAEWVLSPKNPMAVKWDKSVGSIHTDFAYGEGEKHKFDLYLPADTSKESYGLVVYLHAGGFTAGDKADDAEILKFFTSKGYVSAGVNYSLRSENNTFSVLDMSNDVKNAIPEVVAQARKMGYNVDRMAIMGGSAGGSLAMIYAYRDGKQAPVPVKMVFQQVGSPNFDPLLWFGTVKDTKQVALFVEMTTGVKTTPEMIHSGEYREILKPISASEWVDENSPPTLCGFGKLDKLVPYASVVPLKEALEKHNVRHDCFVFPHSGHGLHRDRKIGKALFAKLEAYLDEYMK